MSLIKIIRISEGGVRKKETLFNHFFPTWGLRFMFRGRRRWKHADPIVPDGQLPPNGTYAGIIQAHTTNYDLQFPEGNITITPKFDLPM